MDTRVRVGPFELAERIGAGGMATVWRAVRPDTGESVAVKVMTGSRAFDERYQARFVREVQAVARLSHPGIVAVFDHGRMSEAGDGIRVGCPYLIMELADSGTLEEERSRDFIALKHLLLQVLDALAYSHARGVVHRDIKPANVLLSSSPRGIRAKLTDFGIAHADDPDVDVTRGTLGETAGTPEYMPPEQLRGEWRRYGPWTDLYALGCMAWHMATSTLPFTGGNSIQIAMAHMSQELPPFEPVISVPPGFEEWLARLLQKEPSDRFARAADAAWALSQLEPASPPWDLPSSDQFVGGTEAPDSEEWDDEDQTTIMVAPRSGVDEESEVDAREADDTTVLVLPEGSLDPSSTSGGDSDLPPVPRTWRRAERHHESSEEAVVSGVGLGLFGLREIPFVDRERERDVVWEALRTVSEQQQPHAVLLHGPPGAGKSRLAQWVSRRADELGVASVFHAMHGPALSPKHGIGHMLERYFVTWRMERLESVRLHIRERLEQLWDGDPGATDEFLEQESRVLATVASSGMEPESARSATFASSGERLASVQRVIERVARERPVILWIDDAQWGEEATVLAERLLGSTGLAVLVLVTMSHEAPHADPEALQHIDVMSRIPTTRNLGVGFLDVAHQRELVRRLAGLDVLTAERVVRATGGNPLFAVQLVGYWAESGVLEASQDGYTVADDADFPDEIHGLWQRRVTEVANRLGGEEQRIALELAATLGNDVSDVEWQATCIVADVRPHDRLVDELVDHGLAVRFQGGWSFAHALLADSLRAGAKSSGRVELLHRCCADVLSTLYATASDGVAARIAEHWVLGAVWEKALEPLGRAIRFAVASGELKRGRELLSVRAQALDELGLADDDVRRVENWLFHATILLQEGEPAAADDVYRRVQEAATARGWDRGLARAHRGFAEIAANRGDLDTALEAYARAERHLQRDPEPAELAAVYEGRSWVYKSIGDSGSARLDLERALDYHRESGDRVRELNVFNRLAYTFLAEGDMDASREIAEMGIELGRELGNRAAEAGCWTTLGEIERFDGNIEHARHCYGEAERLDSLSGMRHVWVVRSNMALLELADRQWDAAAARFEQVEGPLRDVGFHWLLPSVWLGKAVCAAVRRDWGTYDANWNAAIAEIEGAGVIDRDDAWLAELAAELTAEAGEIPRARQAAHFAIKQWEGLGEVWRARHLRIELRSWSHGG